MLTGVVRSCTIGLSALEDSSKALPARHVCVQACSLFCLQSVDELKVAAAPTNKILHSCRARQQDKRVDAQPIACAEKFGVSHVDRKSMGTGLALRD